MKALIWIGCMFTVVVILTAFRTNGVLLGALPTVLLYGGAMSLAGALCRGWDESHRKEKQ